MKLTRYELALDKEIYRLTKELQRENPRSMAVILAAFKTSWPAIIKCLDRMGYDSSTILEGWKKQRRLSFIRKMTKLNPPRTLRHKIKRKIINHDCPIWKDVATPNPVLRMAWS